MGLLPSSDVDFDLLVQDQVTLNLVVTLARFDKAIARSFEELAPHYIANYLFELWYVSFMFIAPLLPMRTFSSDYLILKISKPSNPQVPLFRYKIWIVHLKYTCNWKKTLTNPFDIYNIFAYLSVTWRQKRISCFMSRISHVILLRYTIQIL